MRKQNDDMEIDVDEVEEVREVLSYAIESRNWLEAEAALELLNEILGYDPEQDEEEDGRSKRNHLEE